MSELTDEQIESVVSAWFDYTAESRGDFVGRMRKALERAEAFRHCQYCDGTGDVHSIDGEWRGECTECGASKLGEKTVTVADVSRALYNHLMGGTFDIGEAYLKLKVAGACPSEADFTAALLELTATKKS
ncbi:hypothetical protein [Paraburkholderia caffeinilytica]|uniref:hypothetical protein n=1 Tax=Paraburkholderia caffeinilytica TaxID=1761016 RepID=UPI0038BA8CD5